MSYLFELPTVFWLITFVLMGFCIGSFLNVVICRVPNEESIVKDNSYCPHCKKRIKIIDLVPLISYIFLKGKCRYCGEKISSRYFFVELITGLVFASFYIKYGFSPEFFAFSFLMSVLIAVFFIDIEHLIIPDGLVITGLIGGTILLVYHGAWGFNYFGDMVWWGPIIGMLVGGGTLFVIAMVGSMIFGADAMGGGDIKIFAPIGLFLGWKMVILAIFFSFIISGFISMFLLLLKIKDRKSAIPFGPFIVVATYLITLYGHEILRWYLNKY